MASATTNRPSAAMTNAVRSSRFPEFGTAPNRSNSDSSQSSTLGQTFGNGAAWQNTSGIWGKKPIGSGFPGKRDVSRSRAGTDDFSEGPSGSGALAASSEADPWGVRPNIGPWNPDNTSPTLQSQSGSTSPVHTRSTMQSSQQTLLEIQNKFQQPRPAIGQGASFSRPQPKSNLDPSSGTFKFGRKSSFTTGYNDDKENSSQYNSPDTYDIEVSHRYLPLGNGASRDPSAPPHSRGSDSVLNGGSMAFGHSNAQYGSIGGQHTPSTSSHSRRPSFSGPPGSYSVQAAGTRYDRPELEMSRKLAGFGLHETEQPSTTHVNNNSGTSYSQNNTNFTPQNNYIADGSGMWGEGNETFNNYEAYPNQPFADQAYFNKPQRFAEKGSVSPAGSDYRRGGISPRYYSTAGTPPVGPEQIYRPTSQGQRVPQGPGDLEKRLQRIHFAQQQHAYVYGAQFAGQYPYQAYDYPPSNFRQPAMPYGLPIPMPPYPAAQAGAIPTRPAKDQDVGLGVRSVLLEEFRSNTKANKRYELKDIYNHVVEFSGDQHGSRFIQQKLETANSDEKEQLFREIQPNALQLMTDVFGNYVIQKLFEHGNQVQKRVLAEQMKNHVLELSLQMYGCRVVQKALEYVLLDQQTELVQELRADVLRCVKDQNGNHVIQKAIERLPTEHIEFVVDAFRGQVHILAIHSYGCRVIQRILEYCPTRCHTQILEEFHQCSNMLITDQFGNYVTQHVISQGTPDDRARVIRIVTAQLLTLSKHKFASNVVEKSIVNSTDEQRKAMVAQLTALNSDGSSPLQLMMKDQFGNYVIQKLLGQLKGADRESFVEDMKPQLLQLKRYNYGKQIAAIEKLIFTGPQHSYGAPPSAPSGPASRPMPIEINNTSTPMLTNGQNSPQSSSLPSTNVSTIDDTPEAKSIETDGKICPEVVINGI